MAFIELKDVSVEFPIYNGSGRSLKNSLLHIGTGGRIGLKSDDRLVVQALQSVNLTIRAGERVALIGHNGAGKTTLLRVLAGIYLPTLGSMRREGNAVPLFDVALGMDYESTGYENIILRGMVLGHSREKISACLREIAAFADLGDYLSMPLRTYSTGMLLRLAFAISTQFVPDILILDEWLSVGDAAFLEKANERLEELVTRTQILVFSSHMQPLVERMCNRAVLLEHGRIVADGAVGDVYDIYLNRKSTDTQQPQEAGAAI